MRVDAGYAAGDTVPGAYDPMVAKVIVHGADREAAVGGLAAALREMRVAGIATNRPWLLAALAGESPFRTNDHDLTTASTIEVEAGPPPDEALDAVARRLWNSDISWADAWEAAGPFRIVTPATVTFHGDEAGGWQRTVQVQADQHAAVGVDPYVVPLNDGWEVVMPEGRWLVRPGPVLPSARGGAALDGDVRAPMPGKLLQLPVEPGQQVDEDEVVAVLEAMKIEMTLAAPFAGVVTAVSASPGDLVGLRQVIVSIEPLSGDGGES